MADNKLKRKLKSGRIVTGCVIQMPSPQLVEICGLGGFDFVFIDIEHSPINHIECEEMIRAAEVREIDPIVRISRNNPEEILRFLDIGAKGIVVPNMKDAEGAKLAVKSAKYYPRGNRGLAATRSSNYGLLEPLSDYVCRANEETLVFGLIESEEGIKIIDEIISVEGIDGIFLGTNDLAQSLGVPGKASHPAVQQVVDYALKVVQKSGKPVGFPLRTGEKPGFYIDRGIQILIVNAYGLLAQAAREFNRMVPRE
jgi:4-hydroxy-2-oxoheptanedioate aldolase